MSRPNERALRPGQVIGWPRRPVDTPMRLAEVIDGRLVTLRMMPHAGVPSQSLPKFAKDFYRECRTLAHDLRRANPTLPPLPKWTEALDFEDALRDLREWCHPANKPERGEQTIAGYLSADELRWRHGIRPARLSEAASDRKVRTCAAPRGMRGTDNKVVRKLYHVGDALRYCSSKRVPHKNPLANLKTGRNQRKA